MIRNMNFILYLLFVTCEIFANEELDLSKDRHVASYQRYRNFEESNDAENRANSSSSRIRLGNKIYKKLKGFSSKKTLSNNSNNIISYISKTEDSNKKIVKKRSREEIVKKRSREEVEFEEIDFGNEARKPAFLEKPVASSIKGVNYYY